MPGLIPAIIPVRLLTNVMLTNPVTFDLLISLALFAAFAWCVRRGILKAKEVLWIGLALIFFAASLVFNAALSSNKAIYGGTVWTLLGVTLLMVIPFVLALTFGVWSLHRSLIEKELAVVTIDGLILRLVQGNIAVLKRDLPLDALVIPANTQLRMGAGVAGALKSFGGADIEREARTTAPIQIGQAIATGAGRLNAKYVIHAAVMAWPVYRTDLNKIKKGLDGALKCARKIGARRIALPAFGTGVGSTPAADVAPLTLDAVLRVRKDFDEIVIVVFHSRVAPAFRAEFAKLAEKYPA